MADCRFNSQGQCEHRDPNGIMEYSVLCAQGKAELEALVYMPAHYTCPECGFYNVRSLIHAESGAITASTEEPPFCPNDEHPTLEEAAVEDGM